MQRTIVVKSDATTTDILTNKRTAHQPKEDSIAKKRIFEGIFSFAREFIYSAHTIIKNKAEKKRYIATVVATSM